jgi:hypothetical protein
MSKEKERSIMLKVGDQKIHMNPFVDTVFINIIDGLVKSLDKIPEDKSRIEIVITQH